MIVVTVVAFVGLYQANLAPNKRPLSAEESGGVFVAALVIGVVGGGVTGLVIFALMQAGGH